MWVCRWVTLIIPSCLRSILQFNDRVFRRGKALAVANVFTLSRVEQLGSLHVKANVIIVCVYR